MTPEIQSLHIERAVTPDDIASIRDLWREYWESLGLSPCFQGFENELLSLPGAYAGPRGTLLLARIGGQPAGTAAFRPLHDGACEMKRLYVSARYRGMGAGNALIDRLLKEARAAGYREMYCDTLPSMAAALSLYRALGFVEVGPYSANPTPGAIFLRLELPPLSEVAAAVRTDPVASSAPRYGPSERDK